MRYELIPMELPLTRQQLRPGDVILIRNQALHEEREATIKFVYDATFHEVDVLELHIMLHAEKKYGNPEEPNIVRISKQTGNFLVENSFRDRSGGLISHELIEIPHETWIIWNPIEPTDEEISL